MLLNQAAALVDAVSTPRGKAPNRGGIGAGLTEGQSYSCQPSLVQGWVLAQVVSLDLPPYYSCLDFRTCNLYPDGCALSAGGALWTVSCGGFMVTCNHGCSIAVYVCGGRHNSSTPSLPPPHTTALVTRTHNHTHTVTHPTPPAQPLPEV